MPKYRRKMKPRTRLKDFIVEAWPKRQWQIAEEIGLHRTRLSQIVNGCDPGPDEVRRICRYFKRGENVLFSMLYGSGVRVSYQKRNEMARRVSKRKFRIGV